MQTIKEALNEKTTSAEKVSEPKAIDGIINNNTNPLKGNKIESIIKTEQPAKLFKETIVDQIVDKAKLTLSNGKNEMSLELKPEHLGKISLKVVSENGAVMAKIVAENEQVKNVLESNVNMLKENLENQGIKIQGFSISLSDNKSGNSNEMNQKGNEAQKGRNGVGSNIKVRNSGISGIGYHGTAIDAKTIRDYYEEKDSKINFSA